MEDRAGLYHTVVNPGSRAEGSETPESGHPVGQSIAPNVEWGVKALKAAGKLRTRAGTQPGSHTEALSSMGAAGRAQGAPLVPQGCPVSGHSRVWPRRPCGSDPP